MLISGSENLLVEINLRSEKWLIYDSYNPHLNSVQNYLLQLSKKLDFCPFKYENFIVLGNFNAEMTSTHKEESCSVYNFKGLIKDSICFKNPEKPTTIYHVLSNHPRCFQHSGRCITRGKRGGGIPCPFSKTEKSTLIRRTNRLISVIYG